MTYYNVNIPIELNRIRLETRVAIEVAVMEDTMVMTRNMHPISHLSGGSHSLSACLHHTEVRDLFLVSTVGSHTIVFVDVLLCQ